MLDLLLSAHALHRHSQIRPLCVLLLLLLPVSSRSCLLPLLLLTGAIPAVTSSAYPLPLLSPALPAASDLSKKSAASLASLSSAATLLAETFLPLLMVASRSSLASAIADLPRLLVASFAASFVAEIPGRLPKTPRLSSRYLRLHLCYRDPETPKIGPKEQMPQDLEVLL